MIKKVIWFDITNSPQVHLLYGIKTILDEIGNFEYIITARDFAETVELVKQKFNCKYEVVGRHQGKKPLKKALGLAKRFHDLSKLKNEFDISISCGSECAIWIAKLRGKKSIAFGDNDLAKQWTYGCFVDKAFFPNAIPMKLLAKQGLKNKVYLYDGFKEDIYLSNYSPAIDFLERLPFRDYILLRSENVMANYIKNAKTITGELFEKLKMNQYNVLYLPRYKSDANYAAGFDNVFVPKSPINGLDASFYSMAVLTGAGTLAREAACLGVPAVSFYAGQDLLAVDKKMISFGWLFHSRNADEILKYLSGVKKKQPDSTRSKIVREEIKNKLIETLASFGK
jgi:hypothetical protein